MLLRWHEGRGGDDGIQRCVASLITVWRRDQVPMRARSASCRGEREGRLALGPSFGVGWAKGCLTRAGLQEVKDFFFFSPFFFPFLHAGFVKRGRKRERETKNEEERKNEESRRGEVKRERGWSEFRSGFHPILLLNIINISSANHHFEAASYWPCFVASSCRFSWCSI